MTPSSAPPNSNPPDAVTTIHVVSDFVCPWCWLGKRRLDAALAAHAAAPAGAPGGAQGDDTVVVHWAPFELDPEVAQGGVPYKDYMRAKVTPQTADRWAQMRTHLEQLGAQAGLAFDFDALTVRPNTLDAHRVMRWAAGQGCESDLAERLFHAYFADHRDIGSHDVLADLSTQAGLDGALVAELLATDRDRDAVWAEEAHIRALGVRGVPTYIRNAEQALVGAQEVADLGRFLAGAPVAPH